MVSTAIEFRTDDLSFDCFGGMAFAGMGVIVDSRLISLLGVPFFDKDLNVK
jgi:hypothetical protein